MASGSLQDFKSWLPTEFLTEEELLMDKENFIKNGLNSEFNPIFTFPTEFPYEFDSFGSSSSLSSPDESVVSSTETESGNEDDFLAGLTRRLTQQLTVKPEKKWVMAGSPESTLGGIGSWSVSSNGSPNGVLSPPTTPFGAKNDTWDLIYAAAGQVARLKMSSNEGNRYSTHQGRGLLGPIRSQNPEPALKNQNTGFYSSQSFVHSVMNQYNSQVKQEQVLKPQCPSIWGRQQVKVGWQAQPQPQPHHHNDHHHHHPQPQTQSQQQQIQSRSRGVVGYENGRCVRPPLGLPQSAWPPLQVQPNQHQHHHHHHQQPQQHSGSTTGMRAVFLGGSGVKKECAGTGVFLPRRYGNPPESKKKSTCSTVLLPAKVVQALNLNFEDMNINGHTCNHSQPRFNNSFASDYEAFMARRNALLAQRKRNLRTEGVFNQELLPQEWTY